MTTPARTRLSRAFCSARDQKIPVLVRDAPDPSGKESAELVSCLDYGVRCTGWLCPHFALPTLPPEELLTAAIQAERDRKAKSIAAGRAILERALREGRESRAKSTRRDRGRGPGTPRPLSPD